MEKQKADKLILKYSSKVYGFALKKSYSYDEAEELSAEMLKEVYISFEANPKNCWHNLTKVSSSTSSGISFDTKGISY